MYGLNEKLLVETQKKLRREKTLSPKSLKELRSQFGEKLDRALKALENHAVKRYVFKPSRREVWIVVGRTRDYQVIPLLFCMCDDFYLNVVIRRTDRLCYHMLAQMMSAATNRFDRIEESDAKYELFMDEWSSSSEEPT